MGYFETFGSEHKVLTAVGCEGSFASEWGFPPLESFGHSLRLLGFAFQLNPPEGNWKILLSDPMMKLLNPPSGGSGDKIPQLDACGI